jgi:hypothetical protein
VIVATVSREEVVVHPVGVAAGRGRETAKNLGKSEMKR